MQGIRRIGRIAGWAVSTSAVLLGLAAPSAHAQPAKNVIVENTPLPVAVQGGPVSVSQGQPFRARGTAIVGPFGTVVVPLTFRSGPGGAETNTTVPAGRVARIEYVNCSIIHDPPLPNLFIPPGAALMVTDTDPNDFTVSSRTYLPLFDNRVPNVNSSIKAFAIASLTVNVPAGEFVTINFGSLAEGTFVECFAHGVFVHE
jgi:hypothetical protein